ncbi:MAG: glycosyltransferase family 4 protein [Candidatus Methanomethylophilaceae archaeon]|nr:glycosyltransferase family 4 protein [Candidatus Methanomethylophilaceae archaeon]
MKFVDVNPFFFPYKGGIERRMDDYAKRLAARGHDVTILTARLPDTAEEEVTESGYRVVRVPSRFLNLYNPPYVSSKNVLETLEGMDADVVNYNYRWAPSWNKDMARYDGPKLFTCHNMWNEGVGIQARLSEANDRAFIKKVLPSFSHIACISRYVQKATIEMGIPKEMTSFVPCCLSEDPPDNESPEGDYILSLGRLVKTKGLEYMVDAMKDVDCRLVICGKGPEHKRLERRISKLGLGGKIEMRGYVEEDEKNRLMDGCRLFVMPSVFESFGLAAIELMSHRRPIVCTDVNGLPDTVGMGGITVAPKDPAALAEAINRLLGDDVLRARMGELALEQAKFYSYERFIGRYEEILKAVAEGRDPEPDLGGIQEAYG